MNFLFSNYVISKQSQLTKKTIMIKSYSLSFLIAFVLLSQTLHSQDKKLKISAIGYYNLENLFDTNDDENVRDTEFSPEGKNLWDEDRYQEKLANMAYAISQIAIELCPSGLSILGVSEIENRGVLEDLVAHPMLKDRNYQIIHKDSPDERGIDVALLYQKSHFSPDEIRSLEHFMFRDNGERNFTRDVLVVSGTFDGDRIHVLVNHWPSRSGGQKRSESGRRGAADLCRQAVDSIYKIEPAAKIFILGDLNDNPTNKSITKNLRASGNLKGLKGQDLYNPMHPLYRTGHGSNAWRDTWSLFDHVIISKPLIHKNPKELKYHKAVIFNKSFLTQPNGKYKGYPFRTFSNGQYQGGYSDHFPVFVYLTKEL